MGMKKAITISGLLFFFLLTIYFMDYCYLYQKYRNITSIPCGMVEDIPCSLLIPVVPVRSPGGNWLHAGLIAESECYEILYTQSGNDVFLKKMRWGRTGFELMFFCYRVTDPQICRQLKAYIAVVKKQNREKRKGSSNLSAVDF